VAFAKPELISTTYASLNTQLHRDNLAYGVGGGRHKDVVMKLVNQFKTQSVLDYGCGKGYLAKALDFPIWEYDPAIPDKKASPRPADIVICADVLEHVEPDHLLFVLDDLRRVTRKVGYFVIHLTAAKKVLADGRNTHLIQESESWWLKTLGQFFIARALPGNKGEARFVAVPKPR
jgi:2-polyprenyl-3-methyl-5-hydroxy-6-metoxy-1,4-benzoquinol methylase